jgi:hypothetical protein
VTVKKKYHAWAVKGKMRDKATGKPIKVCRACKVWNVKPHIKYCQAAGQ